MSVINTNITSMIGQQNLSKSQSALTTSMERLSSGLRINSAKDDAAGQAIANRMSAQITGLATAQRNANDGISVAQTAEGALNQVNDNLQRIRELAVQAENGTNSQNDLDSIQNEINQRLNEITRISDETSFNDTKVLQSDQGMKIQVGANDGEAITIDLKEINVKTLGMEGFNVTGAGEIDNEAATKDDLTLAGAVQQTDGAGDPTNEYVLTTDNKLATVADVLSNTTGEGSAITVEGSTFTLNADGNFEKSGTYSSDATFDAQASVIADAMQPAEAGDTREATVTLGTESTDIVISSDGNITHAQSEKQLYVTSDGNLSETNESGATAATIDSVSSLLARTADAKIEFADGSAFTTAAAANGFEQDDGTATNATDLQTAIQDAAGASGSTTAAERAEITVNMNGQEQVLYVDEANNVWSNNTGATETDKYSFGTGQATVAELHSEISSNGGTLEITGAGTGGNTTNVGNVYGANFDVALSGEEVAIADINDALKTATAGTYTLTQNLTDSLGNVDTQTIDFVTDGSAVTDINANTFTDTGGNGDTGLATTASNDIYLAAGSLTTSDITNVSYYVQENGNVTNDSGQRIYLDKDDNFTTNETTEAERSSLSDIDNALSIVDGLRSDLGAIQNRMESAIENLSTTETNLSAARSRIEDADYAVEVANMTRAQILQQAGTSVLAQANQIPQSVLSLLG